MVFGSVPRYICRGYFFLRPLILTECSCLSFKGSLSTFSKMNQRFVDYQRAVHQYRQRRAFSPESCASYGDVRRTEKIWKQSTIPEGAVLVTVLDYNVLAQDLIDEHLFLYRNHNPESLEWENRNKLLFNELVKFDADIIALQEVQETHRESFYKKLEGLGYKGFFKKRTKSSVSDGCALYYRANAFDLISIEDVEYQQPGINILGRPNIGIIATLKHKKNNKELIIANTHLLYNPKRWDVRLAQIQILLAELHRVASSRKSPSVMLVGDLNSEPNSPVVQLLQRGFFEAERAVLPEKLGILPNCTHKGASKLYNSKMILDLFDEDEAETSQSSVEGGSCSKTDEFCNEKQNSDGSGSNYLKDTLSNHLSHGFNFSSTYDFYDSSYKREATTYQDRWVTVDYMFYSNLSLISRMRLPIADEAEPLVGRIPSDKSPSDHLPLLATYAL